MKNNEQRDEENSTDIALLKHQQEFDKIQKREKIILKISLFFSKLFNKKIKPDDNRTLQKHKDAGDGFSYYIASPYLQDNSNFCSVVEIIAENGRHVYKGVVGGADNAVGFIESNVTLEEIVSNPYGNEIFLRMLSESNAAEVRDKYYKKHGLPTEKLEGHMTYWSNPHFVLGTITKDKNGKYSFDDSIGLDIEEGLSKEREITQKKDALQDPNDIYIKVSPNMVIAYEGCEIYNGKCGLGIKGVNSEGISYSYDIGYTKKDNDDSFLSIGELQFGYSQKRTDENALPIADFQNKYYDVAIWSGGKNLIQYCIKKEQCGFVQAIGSLITIEKLENLNQDDVMILGGITLDSEGKCMIEDQIPQSVKDAVKQYLEEKNTAEIIPFKFGEGNDNRD
ncbi:MAG TPA: hypothetical protein DEP51_02480 [Clostridiales bacterium]|nr:hypothetical protein [Clostridiales bacterium]